MLFLSRWARRLSAALTVIIGSRELTAVHCDIRALSDPFRERPPLLPSFSDNATRPAKVCPFYGDVAAIWSNARQVHFA